MSTQQATPLPWAVWKLSPDSDQQQRHIIVTADGEHEITGIVHREADAWHIVRCVRLHDEWVKALRRISHYAAKANREPDAMGAALHAIAGIAARTLARVEAWPQTEGPGKGRSALPPDPERMNDKRAAWAGCAVTAFQDATGTDDEDVLSDLMADLMHWAVRNN